MCKKCENTRLFFLLVFFVKFCNFVILIFNSISLDTSPYKIIAEVLCKPGRGVLHEKVDICEG